jgi:hypothetical protein
MGLRVDIFMRKDDDDSTEEGLRAEEEHEDKEMEETEEYSIIAQAEDNASLDTERPPSESRPVPVHAC